jgi:hypothetical protein
VFLKRYDFVIGPPGGLRTLLQWLRRTRFERSPTLRSPERPVNAWSPFVTVILPCTAREFRGQKVNKLGREPKASTKSDQHFTEILSRPIRQVLRRIGSQVRACSLVRPVTSPEQYSTWLGTPRVTPNATVPCSTWLLMLPRAHSTRAAHLSAPGSESRSLVPVCTCGIRRFLLTC